MILYRILKFIFIALIVPYIVLFIVIHLGFPKWAINIIVTLSVAYVYSAVLFILLISGTKKGKFDKNMSLYQWMDVLIDYDEKLTYIFKKNTNKYKTLDNLNSIKLTIMNLTNKKIENLKLYKAFYCQVSKENAEELYFKAALALLSSVAVYWLKDFLSKFGFADINSGFLFILIIFITIAFFTEKLSFNKKRIGLIIEIIDICIEEIEKNNI